MPLIWDLDDVLSLSVENQQPRRVRREKVQSQLVSSSALLEITDLSAREFFTPAHWMN
jgi:hypothetical protein